MQKNPFFRLTAVLLLTALLLSGLSGCVSDAWIERENEKYRVGAKELFWTVGNDGCVSMENHSGTEESLYAWYLLDEKGERVETIWYREENTLTVDPVKIPGGAVRAFVKTGEEISSVTLSLENILARRGFGIGDTAKKPSDEAAEKAILKENWQKTAEELRADGTYMGHDVSLPLGERLEEMEDRTAAYRISSFLYLDEVYSAWKATGEEIYREEILERMKDWAETHGEIDREDAWAWHDDATARRVFRMSYYLYTFAHAMKKEEYHLIRNELSSEAALLASDGFYTKNHNHGMFQDLGLAAYALFIGSEDEKAVYLPLALSRTAEYLDFCFTPDGVHKEHSPEYAMAILSNIRIYEALLGEASPEFTAFTSSLKEKAEEVLLAFSMPDGVLPRLGDSHAVAVDEKTLPESRGEAYLASGGERGERPADDVYYPESGYAVFRSSWDDPAEEATWLLFAAATFSSTHKHGDDLEVLLYHKGPLFTEGGYRDYNYDDPETAWCYSGFAHNVLLLDGEAYPTNGVNGILPAALDTRLTAGSTEGAVRYATGVQTRFEGVKQERTAAYDKARGAVTITDRLTADSPHRASLLFHVASGVEVKETGGGWAFYRDGREIARMKVQAENALSLETAAGEGYGNLHAWEFSGTEETAEGTLLVVSWDAPAGESTVISEITLE